MEKAAHDKARLQLKYEPDDDWIGYLRGTVVSGKFVGEGGCWVQKANVERAFVSKLRDYPLSAVAPPPMIEGGFGDRTGTGLQQCHLRISVRRYGLLGAILIFVELATEFQADADKELQHHLVVRFLTEYGALPKFANQLQAVLDGETTVAELHGTLRHP